MDPDVLVIGAGCIGASVAKHVAEAGHSVVVLEKEAAPAMHQSGRNSGVIHAGYNLAPGSDKARFCVEGSREMRAYCRDRGVAMEQGGILVVAARDAQRASLDGLLANGRANGAEVRTVDREEIAQIEPHASGVAALHAPEGASVDAQGYVAALIADAQAAGARFEYRVRTRALSGSTAKTSHGRAGAKVIVNAAGLHADRLAGELCTDMRIVPFRGFYAEVVGPSRDLVRSHIYGAPHPDFPFLGVHLSRRFDGSVAAGPGAMLAFGRESYHLASIRPDLAKTVGWSGFWRLLGRREVRAQIRGELAKSLRLRRIADEARSLVPALRPEDLRRGLAGNRAQMVRRDGSLVEDMVVRCTQDQVHVLNAVSPGLTCSLPFGRHVAELALARL